MSRGLVGAVCIVLGVGLAAGFTGGCAREAPPASGATAPARSVTASPEPKGAGASGDDNAPSCRAPVGADEVLTPGRVVMLGEMHGTREFPEFDSTLACAAATRGPVSVGLELPQDEQSALDRYLASEGREADRGALLASPFWSRRYQDGRTSAAMFSLLEDLRRLAQRTKRVTVFAMDTSTSAPRVPTVREKAMADAVLAAHRKAPGAVVLTLTGNIHNRTSRGVPWDPNYAPMGAIVVAAGVSVTSLDGVYSEGAEWTCTSAEDSSCGVQALKAKSDLAEGTAAAPDGGGGSRSIRLFTTPSEEGFHGRFMIGKPSASPPAVGLPEGLPRDSTR